MHFLCGRVTRNDVVSCSILPLVEVTIFFVSCPCDFRRRRRRNKDQRTMMMRTRLLWFSAGLASTSAVFSHFVWKDLWVDRHALASDIDQHFHALEARISNLESSSLPNNQIQNPVSDRVIAFPQLNFRGVLSILISSTNMQQI